MQSSEVNDMEKRMHIAAETVVSLAKQARGNPRLKSALRPALPLLKALSVHPAEPTLLWLEHVLARAFDRLRVTSTSKIQ